MANLVQKILMYFATSAVLACPVFAQEKPAENTSKKEIQFEGIFSDEERALILLTLQDDVYKKLPKAREKLSMLFEKKQFGYVLSTPYSQRILALARPNRTLDEQLADRYESFEDMFGENFDIMLYKQEFREGNDVVLIDDKATIEQKLGDCSQLRFVLRSYVGTVLHEVAHLLVLEKADLFKELSAGFEKIDAYIVDPYECGFVSAYAGEREQFLHDVIWMFPRFGRKMFLFKEKYAHAEDIAETIVYWLLDRRYADYDIFVRAKVRLVEQKLLEEYGE